MVKKTPDEPGDKAAERLKQFYEARLPQPAADNELPGHIPSAIPPSPKSKKKSPKKTASKKSSPKKK